MRVRALAHASQAMKALLDDTELVERLRAGDERTFLELVRSLHGQMAAFARTFVRSEAAAEDVVQDTWAAVVRGIGRFEGRSTLRAWIFAIVANTARTHAVRSARSIAPVLEEEGLEPRTMNAHRGALTAGSR